MNKNDEPGGATGSGRPGIFAAGMPHSIAIKNEYLIDLILRYQEINRARLDSLNGKCFGLLLMSAGASILSVTALLVAKGIL